MSTNAGGAQPPTPDTTGGDQPSTQPDHDDLDEFIANNPEALDSILYGEPDPGGDPPPTPDEPDEEPDEAPGPEPDEDPEPEPDEEPSSEEESEEPDNPSLDPPGAPPQRIRLNRLQDDQKRAVASIVEELGKGRTLEEILAERAPKSARTEDDEDDGEQPPAARRDAPTQDSDPGLADVQARIKQAEAEYDAAIEEYDTPKQARLLRELQRLERQELELRLAAREAAAAQQSMGQRFEANVKTLRSSYPDLNDEQSPMSRRLGELRKMALFDDPDAESDPDFILGLAKQAAEDVGASAKTKGKPTSTPPQPKRAARPVGEVSGGSRPVGAAVKTATAVQDFEKMMDGMTDAEKAAWFDRNLPMPD